MLPYVGFNVVERVLQRPSWLFLRCRIFPIAVISRRNVDTRSKEVKRVMRNTSVLEKVLIKQPQNATEEGII